MRSSELIVDAEVIRQQDATRGIAAQLRSLVAYKGQSPSAITLALPPADGRVVTERYAGFDGKPGEHLFLALYDRPAGYTTNRCDYVMNYPAIHDALLHQLKRRH